MTNTKISPTLEEGDSISIALDQLGFNNPYVKITKNKHCYTVYVCNCDDEVIDLLNVDIKDLYS